MARKINVKLIMELRDAGLSRSTIASTRHISRHSVSAVFNIADEKGIRYRAGKNCLPCGGKFTLPSTFSEWTTLFENTAMVAAMVDRLTFQSYILDMNGQSYRLEQTKKQRR